MTCREHRADRDRSSSPAFCAPTLELFEPRLLLSGSLPFEFDSIAPAVLEQGLLSDGVAASLIRLDDVRSDPRFAGIDGAGYSVVVIDTGIDLDHPFFGPDSDSNGIADRIVYNYDFYGSNDSDASDSYGHGSNVAGIIGSSSASYLGVAPGVDIIALKIFPDGGDTYQDADLEEALQWVVDNHATYNVIAVNMSLGGGNYSASPGRIYSDEIASLVDSGVAVVAAAGNRFHTYESDEGLAAPAVLPNVISVGAVWDGDYGSQSWASGAVDHSSGADRIVSFSQRHETRLDVLAPGAKITSANWNGSTVSMSGTSQASPHVAGLVALMQDTANSYLGRSLSVSEITSVLSSTGESVNDGDDEDDNVTNTGHHWSRIDAFSALDYISSYPGSNQDPVLSNARVSPTVGSDATTFRYSVQYFDADGDAPAVANLYIDGVRHNTSLAAGSPAAGIYTYSTTLGLGTHNFFFAFHDGRGGVDTSPSDGGPMVVTEDGEASARFYFGGGGGVPLTEDFGVRYSVDGGENLVLMGNTLQYPGVFKSFPAPSTLRLEAWRASGNHVFSSWSIYANGSLLSETTAQIVNLNITAAAEELSIVSYWGYTPQYYSIGGTIADTGGPVSGVDVSITGSAFNQTVTTGANGIYSFAGVPGGVPYSITAEHSNYSFAPPDFSLPNLTESGSDYDFFAVNSDDENPLVELTTTPGAYVNDTKHVNFAWFGADNKTAVGAIEYRYRLLGSADESWSAWSLGTSFDYDLPNGAYRFEVVARDEAGNVSTFGDTHAFALSASPRVTQAELIDNGIWLGTMDLFVPVGDTDPSDSVMIQAGQFGLIGEDFVPVRLLSPDGEAVYGTIDYATEELGLPAVIEKTDVGFRVTLPSPLAAGETAEYLVQWGRDVHLGWGEQHTVPYQATGPGEQSIGSYLTTTGKHLEMRTSRRAMVPPNATTNNASVELHIYDTSLGSTRIETIEYEAADYYMDGGSGNYYGTSWEYAPCGPGFVERDTEIWVFWRRMQYTYNSNGDHWGNGFALRRFDKETMSPIGSAVHSPLTSGDSYYAIVAATDGSVWVVGEAGDVLVYSKVNSAGQIVAHRQTLATHIGGLTDPYFNGGSPVSMPGGKVAFFYERYWDASSTNSKSRSQVYIKVLNPDGSLFLDETALSPAPADPEIRSNDDRSFLGMAKVDQEGKVWVAVQTGGASGTHYYYSIFNEDGTLFKSMIETPAARFFQFVDADGFVWTTEGSELFMLNADDTVAGGPYAGSSLTPNQAYEPGAASVGRDSYRLFDRWSTQVVPVDVGEGTHVGQMELVDVDKFGQGAHVQGLDVFTVGSSVVSIPGTVPAVSDVDVSGVLDVGLNGLMFSQTGLLGGEMLVSFVPDFSSNPADISVWDGNNELIDGQGTSIDLGTVQQGSIGPSRTFTIRNDGEEPLTLSLPFADLSHFIVGEPGQTTLNTGESTTFTVTLSTDAAWAGQETVSFDTNDSDENPFTFAVSGQVDGPSVMPSAPDLLTASDTGALSDDNVTRLDNSDAGSVLQFEVAGTVVGATVTIYADGTPIGSAVADDSTTTVTTYGTQDLADGEHLITARQTEPGKVESVDSTVLTITIDTASPTADLSHPTDGSTIPLVTINVDERYIAVTFDDQGGSGPNHSTITDSGHEFTLSGAAAGGVTVSGSPTLDIGSTYRYSFSGDFGSGLVRVDFTGGSSADNAGNTNNAEAENFTVGPDNDPDVNVWLVPRIVATSSDTSATLPISDRDPDPFWQIETCDYSVEVWVRTDRASVPAITGGSVNVTFDPNYAQAVSVDHGSVFTFLAIETIDNTTGVVSIGGATFATDMGGDEYVCLGRILFNGIAPVDEEAHQAGPYNMALNAAVGPDDFALVGAGSVGTDIQPVPGVDIRANIYDIDDNGEVNFGDFSYFAPAYGRTVGPGEPSFVWWADHDRNGQVEFGDFSYFAPAYGKPFCDPTLSFPAWWNTTFVTRSAPRPPALDAAPAADEEADVYVLTGDFNADGRVSSRDRRDLRNAYGSAIGDANYTALVDLNVDGRISSRDRRILRDDYSTAIPVPPALPAAASQAAPPARAKAEPVGPVARYDAVGIRDARWADAGTAPAVGSDGTAASPLTATAAPPVAAPAPLPSRSTHSSPVTADGLDGPSGATQLEWDLSAGLTDPLTRAMK